MIIRIPNMMCKVEQDGGNETVMFNQLEIVFEDRERINIVDYVQGTILVFAPNQNMMTLVSMWGNYANPRFTPTRTVVRLEREGQKESLFIIPW